MKPALSQPEELLRSKKGGMKPRLNLKKEERLWRNRQFKEVYTRGRRLKGPHLTIFFMPNKLAYSRLGLSVSKKRFKLSCRRHYIQRRLREAYRLNKMRFSPGYDTIIIAHRFDKNNPRFEDIKKELLSLAQKARLLKN